MSKINRTGQPRKIRKISSCPAHHNKVW